VSASVQSRVALRPRAGARVRRLGDEPDLGTAEVLIAEIGVDMGVSPTAGHLASWGGLCPGNNESAGKHRSSKTRKGNRWLRSVLIQAALAGGTRSTKGALAARYRRVM
jgi:transposase